MSKFYNQKLREGYSRLKKAFEKIIKPNKQQARPSLVLQPVRPNNLRGTDQS
jgi:hypothetical protein